MSPIALVLLIDVDIGLRGRTSFISATDESHTTPRPNKALIKALARAHRWREQLEKGDYNSVLELTTVFNQDPRYTRDVLRLAFLSPVAIDQILRGLQSTHASLVTLIKRPVSLLW